MFGTIDTYKLTNYNFKNSPILMGEEEMKKNKTKNVFHFSYSMKWLFSVLVALMILFSGTSAWSATYYVSTSGNDSAPGTKDQPWAHCPGMEGWKGNASLKAGDVVYFKNSDIWKLYGGSQALWITGGVTYIGDTWGNGKRAKFDTAGRYSQAVVLMVEDHPTLKTEFKGFEVDVNMKESRGIAINNGYKYMSSTGATKRIENCYVHHIGETSYSYGIHVSANNNSTVKNVEIIDCIVHDTPRSAVCLYAGYHPDNVHIYNAKIKGCVIYNAGLDPSAGGAGILIKNHVENVTIEKNRLYNNNDAININRPWSSALPPKNIKIRYNSISHNENLAIYVNMGPSQNVYVYSNLIYNNPKGGLYFESNLSGTLSYYVFNNTFYSNSGNEINVKASSAYFSALEVRNNIFSSNYSTTCLTDSEGGITAHSNNLFYREGNSGSLANIKGKNYYSGDLKNWEPTAVIGSPQFKNVSNSEFFLSDGSPAIDSGAELDEIFQAGLDVNSVWPTGVITKKWPSGNWGIGAFVYDGAPISLMPPENLRIL